MLPSPVKPILTGPTGGCDTYFEITLDNSEIGVEYQLVTDDGDYGLPLTGTGLTLIWDITGWHSGLSFFWVVATADNGGCSIESDVIPVNILKEVQQFDIDFPEGTEYCSSEGGVPIWVLNTETNVTYYLKNIDGVTVGTVEGEAGQDKKFPLPCSEGDFYILGINITSGCQYPETGNEDWFTITVKQQPEIPLVFAPNDVCGSDFEISMFGSILNVNYRLYSTGGEFDQTKQGTGATLKWDITGFLPGTYTFLISATGLNICDVESAPIVISVNMEVLPFDVIYDEFYCASENGVQISIPNTGIDVEYKLFDENNKVVGYIVGTGNQEIYPALYKGGRYRVEGSSSQFCWYQFGPFDIEEIPFPQIFNISSGGKVNEHEITLLNGSEPGITYELYLNGNPTGIKIQGNSNGNSIKFNPVSIIGKYTVKAVNTFGCESWMNGVANIIKTGVDLNIPPDGFFSYCIDSDFSGVHIGLNNTDLGYTYALFRDETPPIELEILRGDGFPKSFLGVYGSGWYFVRMEISDTEMIDSEPFEVVAYSIPAIFEMRGTGVTYVTDITLDGGEPNVNYYLFSNNINFPPDFDNNYLYFEDPQRCEESDFCTVVNFGAVTDPGYYYIWAVGDLGGCRALMAGQTYIVESLLIAVNDSVYLSKDDLTGRTNVWLNDIWLEEIDIIGENIEFKILTEEDMVEGGPIYKKPLGTAHINELGELVYDKIPSYFGRDSLTYRVSNTSIPGRYSEAKVYIMVGNEDIGGFSFILPNAFSPNGDGMNDYFVIYGLDNTETSSLEVFNRWGTIVYRSPGLFYENDWDGKANMRTMVGIGDELPNGVYYFVFNVKKNIDGKIVSKEFKGFVELRR